VLEPGAVVGASFDRSSASRSSTSPRRRSHRRIRFSTRAATAATSLVDGARPSWNVAGPPFFAMMCRCTKLCSVARARR